MSSLGRLEKRRRSKRKPGRGSPGSRTAEIPGAEISHAPGIFVQKGWWSVVLCGRRMEAAPCSHSPKSDSSSHLGNRWAYANISIWYLCSRSHFKLRRNSSACPSWGKKQGRRYITFSQRMISPAFSSFSSHSSPNSGGAQRLEDAQRCEYLSE